jgi:hypothetical protein
MDAPGKWTVQIQCTRAVKLDGADVSGRVLSGGVLHEDHEEHEDHEDFFKQFRAFVFFVFFVF